MASRRDAPPGYERFAAGAARVVAAAEAAPAIREAMRGQEGQPRTLYQYAQDHPRARALRGRGVVWAVPLPDGTPVVVRHSRHGGLLAPLTGDRFVGPTRAPMELATTLRLRELGVPAPQLVGFAIYPAGPLLFRVDVATREIEGGWDLAGALAGPADAATRRRFLDATAVLLATLAAAGARHPDLNLRNVLLAPSASGRVTAHVLDVDRVLFGRADDPRIARANYERLARSARKLRDAGQVQIDDRELLGIARAAGLGL